MSTLRTPGVRQMPDESAERLRELVVKAMRDTHDPVNANQTLIADLYTGRDPGGTEVTLPEGGVPINELPHPTIVGTKLSAPETTANLFLSRLRQIVVSTTPGRPNFDISAKVPGAVTRTEDQQILIDSVLPHTGIAEAFERAAFLGPTQPYFGLKIVPNPQAETPLEAVRFIAIEPSQCGYEPFGRRFSWHTYSIQYADLPEKLRPDLPPGTSGPHADDVITVTEVYHEGLQLDDYKRPTDGRVPMSVYVEPAASVWKRNRKNPKIGQYVGTVNLEGPVLVIDRYLDPAPNEDVPPAEASSWVPLMRQIVQVLVQIVREIESTNSIELVDVDRVENAEAIIEQVMRAAPGRRIIVPVHGNAAEGGRGVDSTWRPIERNSPLGDYLATLNQLMSLFDDVTGVGPIDRGVAVNPEKSATEAASLTAASDRRSTDRLRVLARAWGRCADMLFRWQRRIFGERVELPLPNGLTYDVAIPDPRSARMSFHVDVAELANRSRQGRLETLMTAHTVAINDAAALQDPNALRMAAELRVRILQALGVVDARRYHTLSTPDSPEERYVRLLETNRPSVVRPKDDDNHQAYIAFYLRKIESAQANADDQVPLRALVIAVQQHEAALQRLQAQIGEAADAQSPVPGVSARGDIDNNALAEIAAGQAPTPTPQTVRGS